MSLWGLTPQRLINWLGSRRLNLLISMWLNNKWRGLLLMGHWVARQANVIKVAKRYHIECQKNVNEQSPCFEWQIIIIMLILYFALYVFTLHITDVQSVFSGNTTFRPRAVFSANRLVCAEPNELRRFFPFRFNTFVTFKFEVGGIGIANKLWSLVSLSMPDKYFELGGEIW